MHHKEIENRVRKAQRVVAYLDTAMPGVSAVSLSLLDPTSWDRVADTAGENSLSASTISTVIGIVRGREMAVEAILTSVAQPSGVRS